MLSILLPVLNEEKNISIMVNFLEATIKVEHEVLIIYDSHNDNSIAPSKVLIKRFNNIRLLHNDIGSGIRNAVSKGVEQSKYDIILITTVDEIFPIISVDGMLKLITEHDCDIVTGTRYKYGGKRYGGSLIGHLLSRLGNKVFQIVSGMPVSDATTGMKMFKKKIFKDIELKSNLGWAFAFELNIKAYIAGYKFGEAPLTSIDRLFGGTSTFKAFSWLKEYSKWFVWGLIEIKKKKIRSTTVVTLDSKK